MNKVIVENKKAYFDYFVEDKYEAGIKLKGTEIKSIRAGKVNINDSYVIIRNMVPEILNMHISKYDYGTIYNHDETRTRELLLNKSEINKLFNQIRLNGKTLIPLKVYLKDGLCKIEVGLCKGKKVADKRETIKKRDDERNIQKAIKERNRY